MEIQSQNEHPGDDIVVNNSRFSLKFNPTPFDTTSTDNAVINCCIFIFLCPVFLHSSSPFLSVDPNKAPFFIQSSHLKFKPAFFVYKGQVHLGYQVFLHRWAHIKLKIQLCIAQPSSSNSDPQFGLAQLFLFNNDGDFRPIDVRTIIIFYPAQIETVIKPDDPYRVPLRYPLPFYQSPQLYFETRFNMRKMINSTLLTIGTENHLLTGIPETPCNQVRSITGETLGILPQISHPAKRYLLHCLEVNWLTIDVHLKLLLLGQTKFNENTDAHTILPPCCATFKYSKQTQTEILSNDASTQSCDTMSANHVQTQTMIPHDDDPDQKTLEAILNDLLENVPQLQEPYEAMNESGEQSPTPNDPMMISNDSLEPTRQSMIMILDPPPYQVHHFMSNSKKYFLHIRSILLWSQWSFFLLTLDLVALLLLVFLHPLVFPCLVQSLLVNWGSS